MLPVIIKKIRTESQFYLYVPMNNQILKVDELTWLIAQAGNSKYESFANFDYLANYSSDELIQATLRLKEAESTGQIVPMKLDSFNFPSSPAEAQSAIDGNIG